MYLIEVHFEVHSEVQYERVLVSQGRTWVHSLNSDIMAAGGKVGRRVGYNMRGCCFLMVTKYFQISEATFQVNDFLETDNSFYMNIFLY